MYAYDSLNRLKTLTVDHVGTLLASYTYTLNASGHRIRDVEEQQGHVCLQTTQIYTLASIRKLKEVHTATHPAAKMSPRPVKGTGT